MPISSYVDNMRSRALLVFTTAWLGYMLLRLTQLGKFLFAAGEILVINSEIVKKALVSKMFWGRGSWYKNSFHLLITLFTVFALVTGLIGQLRVTSASEALQISYGQGASNDILQQGGNIQSVLPLDSQTPALRITRYKVLPGENLETVAEKFSLSVDTIRWANLSLVSPFGSYLEAGWDLKIPEINGVLYKVRPGQTVEDVAAITGGTRFDIIEINELVPPNYTLTAGQEVFVPQGSLAESEVVIAGIPRGVFTNPLSHPECAGYRFERGFSGYHNGLDLSRYPGCPIRAIAAGRVTYVGCLGAAGCNVRIDHGGGIESHYYHGAGFWVSTGERVQQGQDIMMMGTTGNSTGVHLHLSLFKNKIAVNPAIFVPY